MYERAIRDTSQLYPTMNVDEWYDNPIAGLNKVNSVKGYHGTAQGIYLNQKLRKQEPLFTSDMKVVNEMDAKMQPTKYPVALDREVNEDYFYTLGAKYNRDNPSELVGQTFTDLGYMSTTYKPNFDKTINYNFFGGKPVFMIVRVPVGVNAMLTNEYEHEITLQRGLTFKVVSVQTDEQNRPLFVVDIIR